MHLASKSLSHKAHLIQLNADIDEYLNTLGMEGLSVIESCVSKRTQAVDEVLRQMFDDLLSNELALFAIGGYGRGELFFKSDVDILILSDDTTKHKDDIERFVAKVWDIGITPAISVQDIATLKHAMSDVSFATSVLDLRFLAGDETLEVVVLDALKDTWTLGEFYCAKMDETKERHLSHHATEYHLEPNIKNGVGTLRDLHMVHWLGCFYALCHNTPLTPSQHLPALTHAKLSLIHI